MNNCACYRNEKEAIYTVEFTYQDGFKKTIEHHSRWKIRGTKENEHGGRPIRVDIYGEVPCADFIYRTCRQLMNPISNEGVHIHVENSD